jgi:DtxR family transcriptional regulator, Mn-dependent transcriptional regulator
VKGAKVRIQQKAPFNGPISIDVAGAQHPLDYRLAESIFVA